MIFTLFNLYSRLAHNTTIYCKLQYAHLSGRVSLMALCVGILDLLADCFQIGVLRRVATID